MRMEWLPIAVAGIMIGMGSGLIIARTISLGDVSASETTAVEMYSNRSVANSTPHLSDPTRFELPAGVGFTQPEAGFDEEFPSEEPRLFPQGDFSPVLPEKDLAAAKPQPSFREELEETAKGFSADALNELDSIRSLIDEVDPLRPEKADAAPVSEDEAEQSDSGDEAKTPAE